MKKANIAIEYNEMGFPIIEKLGKPKLSFRMSLENPNELYIEI